MQAKPVTYKGLTLSHTEWAERLGLTKQAVSKRLRSMPIAEALADEDERERLWHRNMRLAKGNAEELRRKKLYRKLKRERRAAAKAAREAK